MKQETDYGIALGLGGTEMGIRDSPVFSEIGQNGDLWAKSGNVSWGGGAIF